jgi:hypothetical protein
VAISNRRLVALERGQVTFRWKNYRRGGLAQTMTLPAGEFLRRWLLHLLPRGFVRLRSYGLLAHRQRSAQLVRCRALLAAAASPVPPPPAAAPPADAPPVERRCPVCGQGPLLVLDVLPRPPRRQLPSLRWWRHAPLASPRPTPAPPPPSGSNTS